jgi:hypothetical protein
LYPLAGQCPGDPPAYLVGIEATLTAHLQHFGSRRIFPAGRMGIVRALAPVPVVRQN